MNAYHLLLGRLWQYNRKVTYHKLNKHLYFSLIWVTICLLPIKPMLPLMTHIEKPKMLITKAQLEEEVRVDASVYALVMLEEYEEAGL